MLLSDHKGSKKSLLLGFSLQNDKVLPNWISTDNGSFSLFPYRKKAKAQNTQKILKGVGEQRTLLLCFYFAVFFFIPQTSLNC